MQNVSIWRAGFYGICGGAAYLVDQVMNLEFMLGLEGGFTSLVMAVPIAGLLCGVSWASLYRCLEKKDFANAALLLCVFIMLAVFSLGASIYRAGEAYDAKISKIADQNQKIMIAQQNLAEARVDWKSKDRAVQKEVSSGGCGRVCRDKREIANIALKRYELAKVKLAVLGKVKAVDPMADRLSSLLSISEQNIQMIFPLLLPVGIWLASVVFIGLAINEFEVRPVQNRQKQDELPLSLRIAAFMDKQQRLDGKRPTQEEAARYFGVSRSTISRHLAR